MEAQILPGYKHVDGWHCGSTAIRNACRYVGVELSEPMCFGLAAGTGFFYLKSDRFSPSRIFNGRSVALVPPFFHHLGLPFEWHASDELDWPAMRACLDDGRPVILLADIYYLPYYRSSGRLRQSRRPGVPLRHRSGLAANRAAGRAGSGHGLAAVTVSDEPQLARGATLPIALVRRGF